MGVLIAIAVILVLASAIFYNPLRRKVYGIIGVGGSYFATLGIMTFFMFIGTLISLFAGGGVGDVTEFIVCIVFMLIGVGYLVYVMLTRCDTVMQRILLPFIAIMIAFGFCWRFLFALLLRVPMETNASLAANAVKFAELVRDPQGETWRRQGDGTGDAETYACAKTGETARFVYTGGYYLPNGWSEL